MIKLSETGVFVEDYNVQNDDEKDILQSGGTCITKEEAMKNTLSYQILKGHNSAETMEHLQLAFDAIASHDITYVGVIQTAKASGLDKFPVPYVLTNCHNSLCAVGGTLNEDDHMFGLSAAKKYGGVYVPAHLAVIHQYMREMYASCGSMILGSDSHTRYGALGTMAVGEGGGELVKQLLSKTYDIEYPEVIGVHLTGKPAFGIGPQDVALAIIRAVFKNGYVKNKVMEFFGDGIGNLSMDFRNGIDVMTTETTCLTSIWETDQLTKDYFELHGRADGFKELKLEKPAYYDGLISVDLSEIRSMIALPFHPSNAYEIEELYNDLEDILYETEREAKKLIEFPGISLDLRSKIRDGKLIADQGVIAGCAGGTYENIAYAAAMIRGKSLGSEQFALSVYPSSQPVMLSLMENRCLEPLIQAGATIRTAFCGPCFGAGDVPSNGSLSVRHTTRNFPNREGSKPGQKQMASVALMDARSIAATALNHGVITPGTEWKQGAERRQGTEISKYYFDKTVYDNRVYDGFQNAKSEEQLVYGPNIVDWPEIGALTEHLLVKVCSFIEDPVTTTDELIPSGDTSTFRSNPLGMAEFTLSRKDPAYVGKAKKIYELELERKTGDGAGSSKELQGIYDAVIKSGLLKNEDLKNTGLGSVIYAVKPGDGSAREQAASCQRVLGGVGNISKEYATKRYRSNLINWGMIPFVLKEAPKFQNDSYILIPNIRETIKKQDKNIQAYVVGEEMVSFTLSIDSLTEAETDILLNGCLINYYKED